MLGVESEAEIENGACLELDGTQWEHQSRGHVTQIKTIMRPDSQVLSKYWSIQFADHVVQFDNFLHPCFSTALWLAHPCMSVSSVLPKSTMFFFKL